MSASKSTNITWHEGQVSRDDRQSLLGQRGCTIWLTGLSGSGKSTIAVAAEKALAKANMAEDEAAMAKAMWQPPKTNGESPRGNEFSKSRGTWFGGGKRTQSDELGKVRPQ